MAAAYAKKGFKKESLFFSSKNYVSFLAIVFNIRTPDCRSGDVVEHQLSDHKQMGGKNRKRLTPGKFGLLYYSLYAVKPIPYQAGKNQRHTGQGFYLA